MRIFLILYPAGNHFVPKSLTWIKNFYEPLIDLGHEVFLLRIDQVIEEMGIKFRGKNYKSELSQKILDTFKKEHSKKAFDLFFAYLMDYDIYPQTIKEIKKFGIPTTNFSCNNAHQFYLSKNIAPYFDFNLHSEKDAAEKFNKIGANPIWFPMAANPKYNYPIKLNYKYDVSFIGSNYAKRSYYISHLLENSVNVHCFGPDWLIRNPHSNLRRYFYEYKRVLNSINSIFSFSPESRLKYSSIIRDYDFQIAIRKKYYSNLHHPVDDDAMIKLINQSKINLGFLEVFKNHETNQQVRQHLHLREFELPMSGALYFTNFSEELAEFYEPDKEIVVFNGEHELLDKVNYYLKNENKAEQIRKAALERSLKCHTYQKRFEQLFTNLKLVK